MNGRILVAVVAWAGLLLQLGLSLRLSLSAGHAVAHGLLMYFGYFTVLTNLFVALVLTVPALRRPGLMTAAAAAIALVSIAYHLLLRNIWDPQGWQLVADLVLHYVTPALFLVYWFVAVPKAGLSWRQIPLWCAYPALYLAYALIRGRMTGLYPYPFLDLPVVGVQSVVATSAMLLAGFVAICLLLLGAARLRA